MEEREEELKELIRVDEIDISSVQILGGQNTVLAARLKYSGLKIVIKDYGLVVPGREDTGKMDEFAYQISRDYGFHLWPYSTQKYIEGDGPIAQELAKHVSHTHVFTKALPALKLGKYVLVQPWVEHMKPYDKLGFSESDYKALVDAPMQIRLDLFFWLIGYTDAANNSFILSNSVRRNTDGSLKKEVLQLAANDGESAFGMMLNPMVDGKLNPADQFYHGRPMALPLTRKEYLADKKFFDQYADLNIHPTLDHILALLPLYQEVHLDNIPKPLLKSDRIEAMRLRALWLQDKIRELQKAN